MVCPFAPLLARLASVLARFSGGGGLHSPRINLVASSPRSRIDCSGLFRCTLRPVFKRFSLEARSRPEFWASTPPHSASMLLPATHLLSPASTASTSPTRTAHAFHCSQTLARSTSSLLP